MPRAPLAVLLLTACGSATPARSGAGADLAIRDVRVFDGVVVLEHRTVLVARGRIVALDAADRLARSPATHEIDGRGATLLPGLIDAHAHVNQDADPRDALDVGVTTEIDMMSSPEVSVRLARDAAATDRARVVPAGYAATAPGGHGTEYGMEVPTLTTPAEAEAFVAARVKDGSHHLKIIIEGGLAFGHPLPTLDAATVGALVVAAHAHHLLAVAHVGGPADVAVALAGGVDGLVHVPLGALDEATIATIASRGMFVAPTLSVLASVCGQRPGRALLADARLAPLIGPDARATLGAPFGFTVEDASACGTPAATVAALRAHRVPLLAGTDAPNAGTAHGATVHGELERLVAAGLTPVEALTAATSAAARAFALADLGAIRVGAIADLLLVTGDPTRDITATRAIAHVWRGGRELDLNARRVAVGAEIEREREKARQLLGVVADFDRDAAQPTARYGRFGPGSDQLMGGTSSSHIALVDGGAHGSARALEVTGVAVAPGPAIGGVWAGLSFVPAATGFDPVDYTIARRLTFSVRGDDKTYALIVWSDMAHPPSTTFVAPRAWTDVSIDLPALGALDAIRVISWAATQPGAFAFQLDHIAFE